MSRNSSPRNVARSAIVLGIVTVVVRPAVGRAHNKSNGRGRLHPAYPTAMKDSALAMVVVEASRSCWDAGKGFG